MDHRAVGCVGSVSEGGTAGVGGAVGGRFGWSGDAECLGCVSITSGIADGDGIGGEAGRWWWHNVLESDVLRSWLVVAVDSEGLDEAMIGEDPDGVRERFWNGLPRDVERRALS